MARDDERPRVPGYTIRGRIGSGATATVWWAQDGGTGEAVALKVASRSGGVREADEAAAEAREIALLRRLDHPHIVRLHRVVDLPDGRRALVLELAALSLAELLAQRRTMPLGQVVGVLAPVAGALAHLHSRGVVHGDVAPGNILLTEGGRALLADLGVARLLGDPGDHPRPSFVTPGFGAPELRAGGRPTPAADVWGLGRIIESLLGWAAPAAPPGEGGSLAALVAACTAEDPAERPPAALVERVLRLAARAVPLDPPPAPPPERAVTRRAGPSPTLAVPAPRGAAVREAVVPRRPRTVGWRGGAVGAVTVLLVICGAVTWAQVGAPVAAIAGSRGPTRVTAGPSSANDPVAAVRRLASERAKVLAAASSAGLGSVDVVGSAAWRSDAAIIEDLRAAKTHLVGLRFAVTSARLVRWEEDAAVVRTTVAVSEHRRTAPDGAVVVPARRMDPVDLVLVEIASGAWRLRGVRAVPGAEGAGSGDGT